MPVITLTKSNSRAFDTGISSNSPTTNYATETAYNIGVTNTSVYRVQIFFDFGLIPNNAIINSATLRLVQVSSVARQVNVHPLTDSWVDTDVTWNNQTPFDPHVYVSGNASIASNLNIDVKRLVQDMVNGTYPNYGFLLKNDDEVDKKNGIAYSFEYATAADNPTLVIDYTIPTTGKKQVELINQRGTTGAAFQTYTVSLPTGIQRGDLLLCGVYQNTSNPSYEIPNGWTLLRQFGNVPNGVIVYKFAGDAEVNPQFKSSKSASWASIVSVFRNVKSIYKHLENGGLGTESMPPTLDVTIDNLMLVLLNGTNDFVGFGTPLSFTKIADGSNSSINVATNQSYSYTHNKRNYSPQEMMTMLTKTAYWRSVVIALEPLSNNIPTLTLTSPTDNQTLSEGETYTIQGSSLDPDAGNVVTTRYKINNGSARAISPGVSDGSSPIPFSKALTYRNRRLWDGNTDIVGVDLAEGIDHTLTVWADDDQGGKSPEVVRKFRVEWNRPPVISGADENLGTISSIPSIKYSATDPEGQDITITEYIDGQQIRSFPAVSGQEYILEITQDRWLRLSLGKTHQVKIRATDSMGAYSERVYTFIRSETEIAFTLNYNNQAVRDHFILDAQPTRVLVTLDCTIPSGATLLVEVCNNALDETPTWEDVTGPVKAGRGYIFQNATKTGEQWAINIRVTIDKGTATEPVLLNGFGGAFD